MNEQDRTALVAGATGLVGGHLLRRLLASPRHARVIAVGRRKVMLEHLKLRQIVKANIDIAEAVKTCCQDIDEAYCALGTTIKTAGSQAAFRRVDFDYVLAYARAAKAAGAKKFILVSAVGASAGSKIFYSRVKGETEEAVAALGFPTLHIFRPGILLGSRNETRRSEAIMMVLAPFLNPLLCGPARIYRAIPADIVAAAMIAAAASAETGQHVHTYRSMMALANA